MAMIPDVFWATLRNQLDNQIDKISSKGEASKIDFKKIRVLAERVKLDAARDSFNSVSSFFQNNEKAIIMTIDIINCVSIMCALTKDEELNIQGKAFIKEILLNNNSPEIIWKTSLVVLIETMKITPSEFLLTQLGDMFEFFMDEAKGNIDNESNEEEEEDFGGYEDTEFFRMGTTRLMLISNECIHMTSPPDLLTDLFSTPLSSPEVAKSDSSINLIEFVNCCAQSSEASVRVLAFEAMVMAAKQSPHNFAPSAVKVFSTSALGEVDIDIRTAVTSLAWKCLNIGGSSAFSLEIVDTISLDGGSSFTLDSAYYALKCCEWSDLAESDRGDILIALISICYLNGESPLPSLSEYMMQILKQGITSGEQHQHEHQDDLSMKITSCETLFQSMASSVFKASSLIVQDYNFDLEQVLCGTAPLCELRDVAEFSFKEMTKAASEMNDQKDHLSLMLNIVDNNHHLEQITQLQSIPNAVYSHLCELMSNELARTDQQGYTLVLVQWLLGV